jgi:hypothetical protein
MPLGNYSPLTGSPFAYESPPPVEIPAIAASSGNTPSSQGSGLRGLGAGAISAIVLARSR